MSKKFGWKTLLGAVVYAVGVLTSPEVVNILPEAVSAVVEVVGVVLTVFGLRAKVGEIDEKVEKNTAITLNQAKTADFVPPKYK